MASITGCSVPVDFWEYCLYPSSYRLVFGSTDPKTGAAGSNFGIFGDDRHNHMITAQDGFREAESAEMLRNFFRAKRRN